MEDLLPPGAPPGTVPTDLNQSTGLERLEILGKMQGIDVFDMRPLDASRLGTEALSTAINSFAMVDEIAPEDLESLCGWRLVLARQDVGEGGDEKGAGVGGVEIEKSDREPFGRGCGGITIMKDGEDGHATSLTPPCDLAPFRCITLAQRNMIDSMNR